MLFYAIKLLSPPTPIFAWTVDTDSYKNRFPHTKNLLEIALTEKGEAVFIHSDGRRETYGEGSLTIITKDTCATSRATTPRHRHTTVGVTAQYEYRCLSSEEASHRQSAKNLAKEGWILIPAGALSDKAFEKSIVEHMGAVSAALTSGSEAAGLRALGAWFVTVSKLTEYVLEKLDNADIKNPQSVSRTEYVRMAKRYIAEHISQKISVSHIARSIGISEGYLHTVFKAATEMSIVEYINAYRIDVVKQHIIIRMIPLKEAAYLVGIDDPAYMSRLFRKVTGESWREYCERIRKLS